MTSWSPLSKGSIDRINHFRWLHSFSTLKYNLPQPRLRDSEALWKPCILAAFIADNHMRQRFRTLQTQYHPFSRGQ